MAINLQIFSRFLQVTIVSKPVTKGSGGEPPLENFSPPLEKCLGHSWQFKKFGSPSENSSPPWWPKLVKHLRSRCFSECDSGLPLLVFSTQICFF